MDSSLKCNKCPFEEYLIGLLEAERFARTIVEPLDWFLDLPIIDLWEVAFVGEVLAHQPVGVLVQPALP